MKRLFLSLKTLLSNIAKRVYSRSVRILSIAARARLPAYLIEGKEKGSRENLRALILGKDRTLSYFSELIYSGEPSKEDLGKGMIWKPLSKIRTAQKKPDLILVEVDKFYASIFERQKFALLPQWIPFILDISMFLPKIMKMIKNRSLENNLRKMSRQNYSYELTQDADKFDLFYHHMYSPYAVMRYGKSSWVFSYRHMRNLLEKGKLLLVKKDDDYQAGALLLERGKSLFSHSIGVRDGNSQYVEQGIQTALYYFTIIWAKERGYERIDFGYCRPFLQDGVFIYKKRWGMALENRNRSMNLGIFALKICRFSQSVRSFLAKNPFVFIERDKVRGLILAEQTHPLTFQEVEFLMRVHYIRGIDSLVVSSPHGFVPEAREMAEARYSRLLQLVDSDEEALLDRIAKP